MSNDDSPALATPGDCCFQAVKHSGQPIGRTTTIGGFEAYISEPLTDIAGPKKVLLYFSDVFGPFFINAKLVQDYFASHGFIVLGIDYFFGDPIGHHLDDPTFDRSGWTSEARMRAKEEAPRWFPQVRKLYGLDTIYCAVGICFGAAFALDLAATDDIAAGEYNTGHYVTLKNPTVSAAAFAHPGAVNEDHFKKLKKTDNSFPVESRRRAEDILIEIKATYQIKAYSGVSHGFATRGDPEVENSQIYPNTPMLPSAPMRTSSVSSTMTLGSTYSSLPSPASTPNSTFYTSANNQISNTGLANGSSFMDYLMSLEDVPLAAPNVNASIPNNSQVYHAGGIPPSFFHQVSNEGYFSTGSPTFFNSVPAYPMSSTVLSRNPSVSSDFGGSQFSYATTVPATPSTLSSSASNSSRANSVSSSSMISPPTPVISPRDSLACASSRSHGAKEDKNKAKVQIKRPLTRTGTELIDPPTVPSNAPIRVTSSKKSFSLPYSKTGVLQGNWPNKTSAPIPIGFIEEEVPVRIPLPNFVVDGGGYTLPKTEIITFNPIPDKKQALHATPMVDCLNGWGLEDPDTIIEFQPYQIDSDSVIQLKIVWPSYPKLHWVAEIPAFSRFAGKSNRTPITRRELAYWIAVVYQNFTLACNIGSYMDETIRCRPDDRWRLAPGWYTFDRMRLCSIRNTGGIWQAEIRMLTDFDYDRFYFTTPMQPYDALSDAHSPVPSASPSQKKKSPPAKR
ncbi:hypothetical protein NLJ89_g1380 [Agrocybe chaxingu]|uniref:Dienelactone hydrolase domain-containing protein n=1 Tax=Agrocybe chaxingu TaxID=84603 RepID=A0A9W8N061_9AGAR|nr:hypothetical protein NLJ89_g1380 [Agrocybe chaxingu]